MHRRIWLLQPRFAIPASVVVLALAACGGGGSSSETTGTDSLDFGDDLPTHEEIEERAEQESGTLQVAGSFENETAEKLASTFEDKYPFAKVSVNDVSSEQEPTILLEMQSDRHDGDLIKIGEDKWTEYEPLMAEVDLVALHENGSLDLGVPEMIDPTTKKLFAYATYLGVTSWNPDAVARLGINMDEVTTHEDLLEVCDEMPGGQMVTDSSPEQFAELGEAMGDEWLKQYAQDFFDRCDPAFTRGGTPRLTGVAAGEWAISNYSNYHQVLNQIAEGSDLEYKFLEPIVGKMSGITGIYKGSERPYTALLFMEHMASPEAQKIMDEDLPSASFIPDGSEYPAVEGLQNTEVVDGKETSISRWESLEDFIPRIRDIQEIWGFPTGVE